MVGGKVNLGEHIHDAAVREVMEETGATDGFKDSHREGDLKLFTFDEVLGKDADFLPSDWHMFQGFNVTAGWSGMYEAELLHDGARYHLNYYRKADS
jgi:8-oxo-dGTP pyrophosphatase MutT (NUDIX family)